MIYQKLGTLGNSENDSTCSILAAKSYNKSIKIIAYPEFEIAAEKVINGEIDAMLVPGAYPQMGGFIMNNALHVADSYLYRIPALVFVSVEGDARQIYSTMFNHPATDYLLKEVDVEYRFHQNVNSNSTACEALLTAGQDNCAITNTACAKAYGVEIRKVLRDQIIMPFIVFTKNVFSGGMYEQTKYCS